MEGGARSRCRLCCGGWSGASRCSGDRLGRGARDSPGAFDPRSGQAGGPLRRDLQDHRLHPVQLYQFRPPEDPRADAVQGRQPEPAHQPGLEFPHPRARRVHRGDPAAAADRRHVVPGDRGRHLPERLHDREGGAPRHADPGGRPHLQDELRPDDRLPPRAPRRPDDRLPARAEGPGARVRRHGRRRRRPGHRLPREAQGPARDARPPRPVAGVDGHLRLRDRRDVRAALPGRRQEGGVAPRLRQGHHPADARPRRGSSPTRSATRTASRPPTGATSGRSTPTSRRAWT